MYSPLQKFALNECDEKIPQSKRDLDKCKQLLEEMFTTVDTSLYLNTKNSSIVQDKVVSYFRERGHPNFLDANSKKDPVIEEIINISLYLFSQAKTVFNGVNGPIRIESRYDQNREIYYVRQQKAIKVA